MAVRCTPLLASLLLVEQRRASPTSVRAALGSGALDVAPDERHLVDAAAALVAGEPRRARKSLSAVTPSQDDVATVADALLIAAQALDTNWFPGDQGAVLEGHEIGEARDPRSSDDPGTELVTTLAASLLPSLLSARAALAAGASTLELAAQPQMQEHGLGAGATAELSSLVLEGFAGIGVRLHAMGAGPAASYHAVLHADLLARAGRWHDAQELLLQVEDVSAGDPWLAAQVLLTRGDWLAWPHGHPDTRALTPVRQADSARLARSPARALESWAAAERHYGGVASQSGLAAVALRRAVLLVDAGDQRRVERVEWLRSAASLAVAAGTSGQFHLVEVHQALERLTPPDAATTADVAGVAAWAQGAGSASYARGLTRLVADAARPLRLRGDIVAARRALRLAEHLADQLHMRLERELLDTAVGELFGGVSYRLLGLLLALVDASADVARTDGHALEAMGAVDRALAAYRDANALRDARLLARAAQVLERARDTLLAVDDAESAALTALVAMLVTQTLEQHAALVACYQGRAEIRLGRAEEGERLLRLGLDEAERRGDDLMRAFALTALGRQDEARSAAKQLAERLPQPLAFGLLLAVEDYDAARAVEPQDAESAFPPWEAPAQRAELALGLGDASAAAALARQATQEFEQWQSRLGRDVLRTAVADDPLVAGAYLTEVLAHLQLADVAEREGDTAAATAAREVALEAADRLRGGLLVVADDVARAKDDPELRDVLPAWLLAGAQWAAEVERSAAELLSALPAPEQAARAAAELRGRIDDAEAALADAEERVLARAGRAPGSGGARPGLARQVRAALPEDTVLLVPHAAAGRLVTLVVTRDSIRSAVSRSPTDRLPNLVRRAHRAVSRPSSDGRPAELDVLAELLLSSAAVELASARRVVVAAHGPLMLLPWHLLPWDDDVLGASHTVSQVPSVGLLALPGAGQAPRLDRALVVGDPAYSSTRGLPRLPGTATEAQQVARVLGVSPLLDADATGAAVRRAAAGARVWHLATHGLLDEEHPHLSELALAGDDRLGLGELMALGLDADLVVLAACRTGQGRATLGGDVIGAARAALIAGARHLIVSLWPVDDEAGCLVMTDFYAHLSAGCSVSIALQRAWLGVRDLDGAARRQRYEELRCRSNTGAAAPGARDADPLVPVDRGAGAAHPYFWAPFIHVGGVA